MNNQNMNQPGKLYPKKTARSEYEYFFYEKHHRKGQSQGCSGVWFAEFGEEPLWIPAVFA